MKLIKLIFTKKEGQRHGRAKCDFEFVLNEFLLHIYKLERCGMNFLPNSVSLVWMVILRKD